MTQCRRIAELLSQLPVDVDVEALLSHALMASPAAAAAAAAAADTQKMGDKGEIISACLDFG